VAHRAPRRTFLSKLRCSRFCRNLAMAARRLAAHTALWSSWACKQEEGSITASTCVHSTTQGPHVRTPSDVRASCAQTQPARCPAAGSAQSLMLCNVHACRLRMSMPGCRAPGLQEALCRAPWAVAWHVPQAARPAAAAADAATLLLQPVACWRRWASKRCRGRDERLQTCLIHASHMPHTAQLESNASGGAHSSAVCNPNAGIESKRGGDTGRPQHLVKVVNAELLEWPSPPDALVDGSLHRMLCATVHVSEMTSRGCHTQRANHQRHGNSAASNRIDGASTCAATAAAASAPSGSISLWGHRSRVNTLCTCWVCSGRQLAPAVALRPRCRGGSRAAASHPAACASSQHTSGLTCFGGAVQVRLDHMSSCTVQLCSVIVPSALATKHDQEACCTQNLEGPVADLSLPDQRRALFTAGCGRT
jgi:hypothetical protein